MIDLTEFKNRLDNLLVDLQGSSNNTAIYFCGLMDRVQNIASEKALSDFFASIITIGSIAQYGNFSPKQERLLTLLLEEANRIKNQIQ
jgi:NADPH-dependent curcumin reductase CurA